MSRIASNPVAIPSGVEININGQRVTVKGAKGELSHEVHSLVSVEQEDNSLKFKSVDESKSANALAGTTRAVIQNIVTGVTEGFRAKTVNCGCRLSSASAGQDIEPDFGILASG